MKRLFIVFTLLVGLTGCDTVYLECTQCHNIYKNRLGLAPPVKQCPQCGGFLREGSKEEIGWDDSRPTRNYH